jgi:hypothetical protein
MAAMVPNAPGRGVPPVPVPLFDGLAVEEVDDAADDDPQAARVTAAKPRADRAKARRNRAERSDPTQSAPPHVGFDGFDSMVMMVLALFV